MCLVLCHDNPSEMTKALGVDLGDVRIGIAISDDLGMLAHPLETIRVADKPEPVERIAQITLDKKVEIIILGMPRNMNGTYGPAADKARAFAERLQAKVKCEVKFWDERLTSVAAQKELRAGGKNTKNSRAVIDQVAAQLILQGYLDSIAMS